MTVVAQRGEVTMPRLSDSMATGTIARWIKEAGSTVEPGDLLAEIETDKATMEYEAEAAGVLEIVAEEGSTVAVGELIARLVSEGASQPAGSARVARADRVRATPVARRLARERGADLATIAPTGRRGQVMKSDVLAALETRASPEKEHRPEPRTHTKGEGTTLTAIQRTIASRMAHSRATVPDFDVEIEIDMASCLELREQLRPHADPLPSINDMLIKACALTLREHPRVNGAYRDSGFELHEHVNIGMAVATDDGLLVPVLRNADSLSLGTIATTTRALAAQVRERKITPAELDAASFTVSNLGMFGVTRFTAVIDEPQAAILAVGAVQERPVGRDGQIVLAPMMTATLAADHRIVYGADAARFLAHLRELLQTPMRMLL